MNLGNQLSELAALKMDIANYWLAETESERNEIGVRMANALNKAIEINKSAQLSIAQLHTTLKHVSALTQNINPEFKG